MLFKELLYLEVIKTIKFTNVGYLKSLFLSALQKMLISQSVFAVFNLPKMRFFYHDLINVFFFIIFYSSENNGFKNTIFTSRKPFWSDPMSRKVLLILPAHLIFIIFDSFGASQAVYTILWYIESPLWKEICLFLD